MRRAQISLDFESLRQNFHFLKQGVGSAKVMAVVKANGYGHGAIDVARALPDADAFAVAFVQEAVELRQAGIEKPILVLQGALNRGEFKTAETLSLWLVMASELAAIDYLDSGVEVPVWLKVDTGMGRLGISTNRVSYWVDKLGSRCINLMSHFSDADLPSSEKNRVQIDRFNELLDKHCLSGSMANSAAALSQPDAHFDWVRPGISLYGGNPFRVAEEKPSELRPVMTVSAPLVAVNTRPAGSSVGYSGISTLPNQTTVGVVSIGYADGYPRLVQPGAPVYVHGQKCPTLGRVSMDMICVDLNGVPGAKEGDSVELWGNNICVDEVAAAAGAISYELMCQAGSALLARGGRD